MGKRDRGHGGCYLVANGDDGKKYFMYCKHYTDGLETDFKQEVFRRSSFPCRKVHREQSEPSEGVDLTGHD